MIFKSIHFKKAVFIIALISSIFFNLAVAQQRILDGQIITKKTVWRGNILIKGDVVVKKNAKLIIESGTRILFAPNMDITKSGKDKTKSEIIIEGILDIQGDISNKVVFTSSAKDPRMGDWYGITIINPSIASIIEYTIIEYAYNAISTKRSHPHIHKCQIRFNYNAGLLLEVKSNPKIIENIISENGYAGVICKLGSKPVLTGNLIALNQMGVVIFSMSNPNLGRLENKKTYNIGMNNIHDNLEYNIYNHTSEQIFAENNSWGTTAIASIKKQNFDKQQSSKYGVVKVDPILKTEENKDNLIALAQPTATLTNKKDSQTPAGASQNISNTDLAKSNNMPITKTVNQDGEKSPVINTSEINNVDKIRVNVVPIAVVSEKKINKKPIEQKKPAIDFNQVFLEPFLDKKKRKVLHTVVPKVSESLRRLNVTGSIIIRVVVDKKGYVESAQILRGINEYYDEESLSAAKNFRFETGTIKGVPVRFSTNLFFKFD